MTAALRPCRPGDADAIVRLNAASAHWTSEMDLARWRELEALGQLVLVAERGAEVVGFVLLLPDDAPYDSDNYAWLRARLRSFVYVDRIVVGADARGEGVGRALYAEVVRHARAAGCAWVAAEVVEDPPNAGSLAFHERAGFLRIGCKASGAKRLAMLALPLDEMDAVDGL